MYRKLRALPCFSSRHRHAHRRTRPRQSTDRPVCNRLHPGWPGRDSRSRDSCQWYRQQCRHRRRCRKRYPLRQYQYQAERPGPCHRPCRRRRGSHQACSCPHRPRLHRDPCQDRWGSCPRRPLRYPIDRPHPCQASRGHSPCTVFRNRLCQCPRRRRPHRPSLRPPGRDSRSRDSCRCRLSWD